MVLRALAADLALDSPFPIALPYLEEARRLGLDTAQTLSFRSMLVVGEQMQLVELKAVERDYPLRGRLARGQRPRLVTEEMLPPVHRGGTALL